MRLISWNVQKRSRDALSRQVGALARRGPDLVALQEVTISTAPCLRQELRQAGLVHVAASLDRLEAARADLRRSKGGVLLASHWPLQVLPACEVGAPWPERVLSAVVESPSGPVEVHTVYVPNAATGPAVGRPWLKSETFEALFRCLARPSERPRVLCGDFNAPLREERDGTVIPFGKRGRAASAELSIFVGLGQFDLVDVFRAVHGYAVQAFSWYGRLNGYRLDHVFASRALGAATCEYLHAFREARLSDHSPIEVRFAPAPRDPEPDILGP